MSTRLFLVNDAQAAPIRLLISLVLLLELYCLSEILRTFFYWQNLHFDVVDRHLFSFVRSVIVEYLRLIRVDLQSTETVNNARYVQTQCMYATQSSRSTSSLVHLLCMVSCLLLCASFQFFLIVML